MSNMSQFCTCTNIECPLHPTKHDRGCSPCVAKNLKLKEIPSCFFNLVDPENCREDDTFEDFAKCVLSNH